MSQGNRSPSMDPAATDEDNDPHGYYEQARQTLNVIPRSDPTSLSPAQDDTSLASQGLVNTTRAAPSIASVERERKFTADNNSTDPRGQGNNIEQSYNGFRYPSEFYICSFGPVSEPQPKPVPELEPVPEQAEPNTLTGAHSRGFKYMAGVGNEKSTRRKSVERYIPEQVAGSHVHEDFGNNSQPPSRRSSNNSRSANESRRNTQYGQMGGIEEDVDMTSEAMESRDPFSASFHQSQVQNYQQSELQGYASEPDPESMFIPHDEGPRAQKETSYRVHKSAEKRTRGARHYPNDSPLGMSSLPRHPARRPPRPPFEPNIGSNRRTSRYAGLKDENWHVNKHREPIDPRLTLQLPNQPPIRLQDSYQVSQGRTRDDEDEFDYDHDDDEIEDDGERSFQGFGSSPLPNQSHHRHASDRIRADSSPTRSQHRPAPQTRIQKVAKASLNKRGLREGQEEEVLLRGYGVNDPENVEIVNLKESGNYNFDEIARILNDKRLEEGRDPKLTTTGVNGRYNRTAPTLFESQGLYFVPLLVRKKDPTEARKHGQPIADIAGEPQVHWNPAVHDRLLVEAVREYNQEKWTRVAEKFAAKAGFAPPETQLAKRFVLL